MRNPSLLPVNSQEFKDWFQGSVAVDSDGNPLLLFHGSEMVDLVFDPAKSKLRIGAMFTSRRPVAEGYQSACLYEAYLSVKNPTCIELEKLNIHKYDHDAMRNQWISNGHDGVIVRNGPDKYFTAFSDEQILVLAP